MCRIALGLKQKNFVVPPHVCSFCWSEMLLISEYNLFEVWSGWKLLWDLSFLIYNIECAVLSNQRALVYVLVFFCFRSSFDLIAGFQSPITFCSSFKYLSFTWLFFLLCWIDWWLWFLLFFIFYCVVESLPMFPFLVSSLVFFSSSGVMAAIYLRMDP